MADARSLGPRPTVVLVTGEPGSGKTTLGRELAAALRVPFLARDDVRGGLFFTQGAWSVAPREVPGRDHAVEVFLEMVVGAARLGVSCVAEYVARRTRPGDLRRLAEVADCFVLITTADDAKERLVARMRSDRLLNRPAVLDALGHTSIEEHTLAATARLEQVHIVMERDFEWPTLRVGTADGYDPDLETVIDFVTGREPQT